MTPLGNLQFDNNSFNFEETNIYGIFEPHGYMTWHIEMFPPGEGKLHNVQRPYT